LKINVSCLCENISWKRIHFVEESLCCNAKF